MPLHEFEDLFEEGKEQEPQHTGEKHQKQSSHAGNSKTCAWINIAEYHLGNDHLKGPAH